MRNPDRGWLKARRLARVVALLTLGAILAGATGAAAQDDELVVTPVANAPGWITVYYQHSDPDGAAWYVVEREGGGASPPLSGPTGQWTDVNLSPDTEYRYRACAVPDSGDPTCSGWTPERTMPAPGRPSNFGPPIITNVGLAPDSITVSWGATGDYTRILARIDDDQGNHNQVRLQNIPFASYTWNGLRAGALYRVILKGCSFSLNNGCGPWSPDQFFTTPLPPQPAPPPGTPALDVVDYSSTFVKLAFSVRTQRAGPDDMFLVFRDDVQLERIPPTGSLGGYVGGFLDNVGTRHRYMVCFQYTPSDRVCSREVVRPKLLGEELTEEGPCLIIAPGCDDNSTVDYGSCPGCDDVHPDTCISGYVWREAYPGDTVCVEPWVRDQSYSDNAAGDSRRQPDGSLNCISGYVWREAYAGDTVCVEPWVRDQAAIDNTLANERRLKPR